jgi:hypothetical protein
MVQCAQLVLLASGKRSPEARVLIPVRRPALQNSDVLTQKVSTARPALHLARKDGLGATEVIDRVQQLEPVLLGRVPTLDLVIATPVGLVRLSRRSRYSRTPRTRRRARPNPRSASGSWIGAAASSRALSELSRVSCRASRSTRRRQPQPGSPARSTPRCRPAACRDCPAWQCVSRRTRRRSRRCQSRSGLPAHAQNRPASPCGYPPSRLIRC